MKVFGFSLDEMRCPETLSHWRKLRRQHTRCSWVGNSEIEEGGGGEGQQTRLLGGNTRTDSAHTTTRRNVLIGAYTHSPHQYFMRAYFWSGASRHCASCAHSSAGSAHLQLFHTRTLFSFSLSPPPTPPPIWTDMPDRRFCWNIWVFSESVDDLMAKPECRNMDACLRRLKQELVRPVWYHHQ